jgi:hypothetical protein
MNILAIAEQTRKDWLRSVDSMKDPHEFDITHRPAPPTFGIWEQSFDVGFDPRVVVDPPLLIEIINWVDMERDDPARTRALQLLGCPGNARFLFFGF